MACLVGPKLDRGRGGEGGYIAVRCGVISAFPHNVSLERLLLEKLPNGDICAGAVMGRREGSLAICGKPKPSVSREGNDGRPSKPSSTRRCLLREGCIASSSDAVVEMRRPVDWNCLIIDHDSKSGGEAAVGKAPDAGKRLLKAGRPFGERYDACGGGDGKTKEMDCGCAWADCSGDRRIGFRL